MDPAGPLVFTAHYIYLIRLVEPLREMGKNITLLSIYGKFGNIIEAENVFVQLQSQKYWAMEWHIFDIR